MKGAAEYHKNSGCKVKACKDLYLLLNDACVLESSVTTESLDDLLGLAKQLLDLGRNTFAFVLCCNQNLR